MVRIALVMIMTVMNLWHHAPYNNGQFERVRQGNKTITYYNDTIIKAPEYRVGIAGTIPKITMLLHD